MPDSKSPLAMLREMLLADETTPAAVMRGAQLNADESVAEGGNTYVWREAGEAISFAETLPARFPDTAARPPLYGVPVSVKDCFDVAGTVTGCGSKFYAGANAAATENSWIVKRLLDAGATVTGKTHLHQLAYGITGENEEYGDSVQPRDRSLLTGGSSSGACASVQEGSAMVAVGTDTGGSVRVPAALCGLAGYRASHGLFPEEVCWKGGAHLAQSFDTLGLLFRDLRDGPVLGEAVFGLQPLAVLGAVKIGVVGAGFLHDCEPAALAGFEAWKLRLRQRGAVLEEFDTEFWAESVEVFTTIQATEAASIHRGHFAEFETAIGERLAWGESIAPKELAGMRARHKEFCKQMVGLYERYDFLILPCAPVGRLVAGEDQSGARKRILRYTAPISMAGLPTVTLPGEAIGDYFGTGVQLVAKKMGDGELLGFAAGTV
jgi:Asp-tRNA(Asn)/Glu-tRNA(Gln) amidotransferase A subunit family amidase